MATETAARKSRAGYRSAVTRSCKLLAEALQRSDVDEFEVEDLLEKVEKRELAVQKANELIQEKLSEDKIEEFVIELTEWEDDIGGVKSAAKIYLKKQKAERDAKLIAETVPKTVHGPWSAQKSGNNAKLPKLEIKKFNGDVGDWQRFWDQFQQAVHFNKTLDEVTKFSYLRSMLENTALDSIAGLSMTSSNYAAALLTLQDRFGKKELIIHFHMAKLLKMSAVKDNSSDPRNLRRLYDDCISHVQGLKALGVTSEKYGCLLCPIIMQLVPEELIIDWRRRSTSRIELYDLDTLLAKLKAEVEGKEDLMFLRKEGKASGFKSNYKSTDETPLPSAALLHAKVESQTKSDSNAGYACIFCDQSDHRSIACKSSLSVNEKKDKILRSGRCFVCLGKKHVAKLCRSKGLCQKCNGRHNTQICYKISPSSSPKKPEVSPTPVVIKSEEKKTVLQACVSNIKPNIFTQLQIFWAWAEGTLGKIKVRCVLDNGSQRSFVTVHTARQVGAERMRKECLTLSGIAGRKEEERDFNVVKLTLKSLYSNKCKEVELIELTSICGPVEALSPKESDHLLRQVGLVQESLTDEKEDLSTTIDLLLGQDVFWTVVTGQYKRLSETSVVMESLFGWSIEGKVTQRDNQTNRSTALHFKVEEVKMEEWAEKLWSLEAIGIKDSASEPDEQKGNIEVHKRFNLTTEYKEGRYSVRLPWKTEVTHLESNYTIAKERMMGLVRRFESNPEYFLRYKSAIETYMEQGHAEEVLTNQAAGDRVYYIPHHAVIREERATTKVRVVFDASAHRKGEDSLNNCLWSGPNLNPEIVHLLLGFRMRKIALIADIEKAFLQVGLSEEDRDATRFLWVDSNWKIGDRVKLKTFRMTRVLFGATCSPYLLAATLRFHAKKEEKNYPEESKILDKHTYVDDLVSAADDEEKANTIKENMQSMLQNAGMKMKKWLTNSSKLFEAWKTKEVECGTLEELNIQANQNPTKVLGIVWNPKLDEIMLPVTVLEKIVPCQTITKRVVLKCAAQVYDPLGYIAPVVMKARCLFQELWKQKFSWDKELPDNLSNEWRSWCTDLQQLQEVKWPRYIRLEGEQANKRQLHVFCDASEKAYGAVIYIRMENSEEVDTFLLICKGRVAPIKQISLPRLELMSATIAARLVRYIAQREEFAEIPVTIWSDSQVTLKWIKGTDKQWKVFVQNRVNEIRSLTDVNNWHYCSGQTNPADIISRGETLTKLRNKLLWWKGPEWLRKNPEEWPQEEEEAQKLFGSQSEEETRITTALTVTAGKLIDLERYSQLERAVRVTAWVLRAVKIFQKKTFERTLDLTVSELFNAMVVLIKQTQTATFQVEISVLESKKLLCEKQSTMAGLNPFLDELGIIRMGGRLQESNLHENEKHPVILPVNNKFSELLILECHEKVYHGGVVRTLAKLREGYWVVRGRQFVKKTLNRCYVCRKLKEKPYNCIEAPLPKERLTPTRPFSTVGVDFAGPVLVKTGNKQIKAYITLFTCAVTRAVHLELVTDLSTAAFLRALRRFFARRGVSLLIFSDNAKTFKRANLELAWIWEQVDNPLVHGFCTKRRIEWKFIAAKAPWWGGFWERMIQTIKRCLRKLLGKSCVSQDEMSTVLTEIEAIVNQRPISYLSDEPLKEEPLTPAHFLNTNPDPLISVGRVKPVEGEKLDQDFTRNWKHRQRMLEHFWKRWKTEYLLELRSLQQRRNLDKEAKIKQGDVVIVHNHRQPRHMWGLARVKEVQVGRDGQVRSCMLRQSNGQEIRRPIQLIYPLEGSV